MASPHEHPFCPTFLLCTDPATGEDVLVNLNHVVTIRGEWVKVNDPAGYGYRLVDKDRVLARIPVLMSRSTQTQPRQTHPTTADHVRQIEEGMGR
jgi:hypothetical protein